MVAVSAAAAGPAMAPIPAAARLTAAIPVNILNAPRRPGLGTARSLAMCPLVLGGHRTSGAARGAVDREAGRCGVAAGVRPGEADRDRAGRGDRGVVGLGGHR